MFAESLSRKDFIRQSSILLAGTTGFRLEEKSADMPLRLKNVRLEAGFVTEDGDITATRTELATLELRDGKITAILPNDPSGKGHDAKGALALPAFRDMHIHLDKTYYGDQWKARSAKNRSLRDMIAFEQRNLPELLKNSTFKAEKLIELCNQKVRRLRGVTSISSLPQAFVPSITSKKRSKAKRIPFRPNWSHFRSMACTTPTLPA